MDSGAAMLSVVGILAAVQPGSAAEVTLDAGPASGSPGVIAAFTFGPVARRCGYGQTGLRNLAAIFLDIRIPKGSRTSNWAAAQLTRQQITYAATDAWVCRELFLRFETLGLLDR